MGQIVYAAAMSHVLYPEYYGRNVGPHGHRMVEELIAVVRQMGRELTVRRGSRPVRAHRPLRSPHGPGGRH
jgi:hypothetical protein